MESVGSDLRSAREKQNISLAQMAADTRISLHYLECLESGRYRELPGGMYNRAFLRAYCEKLNLNQKEILSRYESEISPPFDKILKSKIHVHQKDTSLKISPILIWSGIFLISATGLFFSREWIAEVFSPYFSRKSITLPSEIAKPQPPPPAIESTTPPAPPESSEVAPPSQSGDSVASAGTMASETSIPNPDQSQTGQDLIAEPSRAALRLEIGISEKCWVSVDRDGKAAVRRLMDIGDVQSVDANERFLLILGNAGGAHLKINGKSLKQLGKSGEVVRLLIDEKNLQDLFEKAAG